MLKNFQCVTFQCVGNKLRDFEYNPNSSCPQECTKYQFRQKSIQPKVQTFVQSRLPYSTLNLSTVRRFEHPIQSQCPKGQRTGHYGYQSIWGGNASKWAKRSLFNGNFYHFQSLDKFLESIRFRHWWNCRSYLWPESADNCTKSTCYGQLVLKIQIEAVLNVHCILARKE